MNFSRKRHIDWPMRESRIEGRCCVFCRKSRTGGVNNFCFDFVHWPDVDWWWCFWTDRIPEMPKSRSLHARKPIISREKALDTDKHYIQYRSNRSIGFAFCWPIMGANSVCVCMRIGHVRIRQCHSFDALFQLSSFVSGPGFVSPKRNRFAAQIAFQIGISYSWNVRTAGVRALPMNLMCDVSQSIPFYFRYIWIG